MRVENLIKDAQPKEYSKLKQKKKAKAKNKHSKGTELTERDLKELMGHSSYRRCGGAIRQVR